MCGVYQRRLWGAQATRGDSPEPPREPAGRGARRDEPIQRYRSSALSMLLPASGEEGSCRGATFVLVL